MVKREQKRALWLANELGEQVNLTLLAGGASSRQFFRFFHDGHSYILMDVPLDDLPCFDRYVHLTDQFAEIGLRVPAIYAMAPDQGWAWLEDFGDDLLGSVLSADNASQLSRQAIRALLTLQSAPLDLPAFDRETMAFAMRGFQSYCLKTWLGLSFKPSEQAVLNSTYELLVEQALNQPQAPMHRDYHCQNLLCLRDGALGIIDFQDAKIGPVTYDAVSFLRDCYVDWSAEQILFVMKEHYEGLCERGVINNISFDQFQHWFDWMGLERHLKACFTFVRKLLRDNDAHYLQYLPRTLNYIEQVSSCYSELKGFHRLLIDVILPRVEEKRTIVCEKR